VVNGLVRFALACNVRGYRERITTAENEAIAEVEVTAGIASGCLCLMRPEMGNAFGRVNFASTGHDVIQSVSALVGLTKTGYRALAFARDIPMLVHPFESIG
jgi:hypothetical protein